MIQVQELFYVFLHLSSEEIIFQSVPDIIKFNHQEANHISSFFDITVLYCAILGKLI